MAEGAYLLFYTKASYRKMSQGADIGTAVHSAIESHVNGDSPLIEGDFTAEELAMANLAFSSFTNWWLTTKPKLINAEQMVYSKELDYSGAYDGLLEIPGRGLVLSDWKTSNASASAGAPQGAYYSYFAQSAAYALALKEMTGQKVDDLLVVSCRKDGKFDTVYLSDLGMTVPEAVAYWRNIVGCYRAMDKLKRALVAHAK